MITIAETSVVTVYSDLMAVVLSLGLAFMFHQYRRWKDEPGDTIFVHLCILIVINGLFNGFSYAMHKNVLLWPDALKRLFPTVSEFSALVVLYVWLLYVDYKLYGSRDRVRWVRFYFRLPILILGALCVINLFTGILFTMDESCNFVAKPLFYVLTVMQYVYGIIPILVILHYIKNHGRLKFFHILPVAAPVIAASLFTLFSDYSARAFGFAVGLVFLHCSYANLFRFCDGESGFYNRDYYDQFQKDVKGKKKRCEKIMCFEVKNPVPAFFDILRQELPKDGEIMRIEPHLFLLPLETGNASMQRLLSAMVEEEVSEYEKNHPTEAPIGLTIRINREM